jgi:acetyl esterase/lipase
MQTRPPIWCPAALALCLWGLASGATDSWAQQAVTPRDVTPRDVTPTDVTPTDVTRTAVQRLTAQPYIEREGRPLLADVYLPPGSGPFPAVLMIHGGAWRTGTRVSMALHATALAEAGYVVTSIDYRLAPAHPFPAQLDDCRAALAWMHQHAAEWQFDPARVAVYGYSAGAHLACLLGLQVDNRPQLPRPRAVVAGGTPCDFEWLAPNSSALAYFLGGTRRERPDVYRQASPVAHASADDPPVYLFHGEKDRLVPLISPQRLQRRLAAVGVTCELNVTAGGGHVWTFLDPQAARQAIQFLDRVLKDRPSDVEPDGNADGNAGEGVKDAAKNAAKDAAEDAAGRGR